MHLSRGDTVNLFTDDEGRLVIHPSLQMLKTKTRCIIHAGKVDDKLLRRLVLAAYVVGHDAIEVSTGNVELATSQLDVLRRTLNELIGVGIVEQETNRIVIQSFLDPSKFPIDGLISRLHLIVESMRELAVRSLLEERDEFAKQVIDMDVEADKVYFLATRLLIQAVEDKAVAEKVGLENPRNIIGDRIVVKALEEVGDYAQVIAKAALRINALHFYNAEVNKQIVILNEHAKKIGALAMHSLFKIDVQAANAAINENEALAVDEEKIGLELDAKQILTTAVARPIKAITHSIKQIGEFYTIAAETIVNRAVGSSTDFVEVIQEH
jgi:phosphate uptake regulator